MNKEIFPEIVHSDQRPFAANSGSHSPPDQVPLEEPRDRVHGSVVPCVSGLAASQLPPANAGGLQRGSHGDHDDAI